MGRRRARRRLELGASVRETIVGIAVLAVLGVAVWAGILTSPSEATWEEAQTIVERSTARVDSQNTDGAWGVCTAFSINEDEHYFLTAYHCLADVVYVDRQIAWVVYSDEARDLAVLESPGAAKPALRAGDKPRAGMSAAAYGFGAGFQIAQFRVGKIAAIGQPLSEVTEEQTNQSVFMFDQGFMHGMSGGPVVDIYARVLGIVQLGDRAAAIGFGRQIEDILAATSKFWEK